MYLYCESRIIVCIYTCTFQVARRPLESEHGDPFTLLNTFDEWVEVRGETETERGGGEE